MKRGVVGLLLAAHLSLFGSSLCFATDVAAKWRPHCIARELTLTLTELEYHITPSGETLGGLRAHGWPAEDADGQVRLHLDFKMVRSSDGTRHPLLRGREQFEDTVAHFKGRVQGISADWQEDYGLLDNLNEFNRLTGPPSNLSAEAAARQTWTGKHAAEAGYTKVKVANLEGRPGKYKSVQIYFDQPGAVAVKPPKRQMDLYQTHDQYSVRYVAKFNGVDSEIDRHLMAQGILGKSGGLDLHFHKGSHVGVGAPRFDEGTQLKNILDYFEGRFTHITQELSQDMTPAALAEFNRLTGPPGNYAAKAAAEEAGLSRRLQRAGYGQIKVLELIGKPGHYTQVRLRFDKD